MLDIVQSSPLRAIAHYRILPTIVPVSSLCIAALARIPYSIIPLGAVTGVARATGDIALGGLTTAIIALSSAVAAPLLGRLSDRTGTSFVLRLFWPLSALATALLLCAALQGWTSWPLYVAAVSTGATMIPVGALTRARWVILRPDPRTMATAFSYETMIDELMFVVGPILVGVTSIFAGWAPLALAVSLIVCGVGALTWDSRLSSGVKVEDTTPPRGRTTDVASTQSMSASPPSIGAVLWSVTPLIGSMIAMGLIFGTTQTGITERALSADAPSQAGLWYGMMGIGSAIISILAVLIPQRVTAPMRIAVASTLLIATTHTAAHLDSLPLTGTLLFASGFGIGTILVTSFATAEKLCPSGGIAVAMTAMPAAITVGVSAGSVIGGQAATYGSHVAFHAATAAGALALLCSAWLSLRIKHRR